MIDAADMRDAWIMSLLVKVPLKMVICEEVVMLLQVQVVVVLDV